MGLCKCAKKVVSNLFCFDHRVTVCESCLVLVHKKCVIQSYLSWLKDSDYDSTCTLCGVNLEDDDCIRLICYDLYHKKCLDDRQKVLPPHTAPTGHSCPKCNTCIFPPQNLVSPVADALRVWLSQVNWGRSELSAMSTFQDDHSYVKPNQNQHENAMNGSANFNNNSSVSSVGNNATTSGHHRMNVSEKVFRAENPHSVLNIESRPLLRESPIGRSSDRDENKYKRKTPQEIFSRWSRQFYAPAARPPWKRTPYIVGFGIVTFIVIIYLMYHFGRSNSDEEIAGIHYDE